MHERAARARQRGAVAERGRVRRGERRGPRERARAERHVRARRRVARERVGDARARARRAERVGVGLGERVDRAQARDGRRGVVGVRDHRATDGLARAVVAQLQPVADVVQRERLERRERGRARARVAVVPRERGDDVAADARAAELGAPRGRRRPRRRRRGARGDARGRGDRAGRHRVARAAAERAQLADRAQRALGDARVADDVGARPRAVVELRD